MVGGLVKETDSAQWLL